MGVAIGTAVGNLAAGAIQAAASAITGFISKGIAGASNLGESMSKVEAVFGASAGTITGVADELAKKFGLPKQAILDAGAAIGLVGKAAGQSQGAAAEMGAKMAKLAADASSFYNVPLEDALNKIRSGLVGESEPMRAFGVLLSEEAVAAEAVAMGLAKSSKEVDNQAKVLARASLITKGLGDATGDLERTADSTSNQWRKFTGGLENLAVTIGSALLPAVNSVITLANEMTEAMATGVEGSKSALQGFADGVKAAVDEIAFVWRNFSDVWEMVIVQLGGHIANFEAVMTAVGANIVQVAEYIARNWKELIVDAVSAVLTAFQNLGENVGSLAKSVWDWLQNPAGGFNFEFKPLLDGFQKTAEALPEMIKPAFVSVDQELSAIGDRIAARETKRLDDLKAKQAALSKPAQKAAEAAATKQAEFKSETMGVAEFATKMREAIFAQGDKEIPKQQLEESKKQTKVLEETRDQLKHGQAAVLG